MAIAETSLYLSVTIESCLFFLLLVTFAILTAYHFWFQSLRSTKLGNKLPGYPTLPIIGNALIVANKNANEIMKVAIEMSLGLGTKIGRFWFGNRLGVVLGDLKDVELILGSKTHLEKSKEYDFFQPWLGDGLLISKGETWRSHRKMIVPTFHQSILKTFMPVFNKNAQELVEELRQNVVGQICDIHDYMGEATVNVLLETVMGTKKTKEDKYSFKYAKAVMDMCGILFHRQIRFWLRPDIIFRWTKLFKKQKKYLNIIHSLTDFVIKLKKKDYLERVQRGDVSLYNSAVKKTEEEKEVDGTEGINFGTAFQDDLDENDEDVGEKKRLAFLDFMVEASHNKENKLSDLEIRDEVNTIMFEGHDTTAAATSFFICILGVYPDIQKRVYQEIEDIFQGTDRSITFKDTLEMKYLERVLLETLRLYPPVPIILRDIREEIKLASADYIVPKDTTIGIPIYLIHRDEEHYPNPDKFDPDNFLPERCQQRPYLSFIPFSAGPRSCVGRKYAMLKMKVLLASIVKNFKIKSVVEEKDFQLQGDIILKRSDGFRVILEEREKFFI